MKPNFMVDDLGVTLNGLRLAVVDSGLLKEQLRRAGSKEMVNGNYVYYYLDVEFLSEPFLLCCRFDKGEIASIWLKWLSGSCAKLGFDSTEAQLLSDTNHIKNRIRKTNLFSLVEEGYNFAVFSFKKGVLRIGASLQNFEVNIEIFAKK
ncbi:hypothetical protein [Jeongeupia sp. USM3]|uniref:hypothetical protein n=1 Tax=Jeongeupia sp. USM3 TaxID=1906741 RepID=UPI0011AB3CA8|nr:hypothetical protein [Jeongeupia sp. USM3]